MAMPPGSFCMRCGVYCNEKKRCFKNNRICGCSTATKAADATTARRDVPSTPQGRRRRRLLAGGRSAPAAAAAAPPVAPAATSLDEQQPRSRRLAGIGGGRSGDSGTRDLLKSAVSSKADRADDGERAILEQLLCANAPVLVMCHTTSCSNCSRGLSSGYVSAIFQHRKLVFKKSVRSNTRGGIFDWY